MNFLKHKKYSVFFLLLFIVILFFLWSRLFWISILLLILADTISTKITVNFLIKRLPKIVYTIIKYCGLLTLPVCIAIFIRTFFFDVYFVPSSSMERTLFPNDYILINKFLYGTKLPNYKRDIPVIDGLFKKNNTEHNYNLYTPLKAFKNFYRDDIVVFKSTETNDKFLVKRVIGLPGDTLQIKNTDVFINNKKLPQRGNYCYNYLDTSIVNRGFLKSYSNKEFKALNFKEKKYLKKNILVKQKNSPLLFPYKLAKKQNWTRDNYGQLIIPKKGQIITISLENYDLYKSIIQNYEQVTFQLNKGEHKIYTFKNNYYFMMGDNRHNSIDSRSYGFVPESYIQGKMIKVF